MIMLPKEYEWLLSHPEVETEHAGEFIAILGESIVAHGRNLREVLKEAEKNGKKPFIRKVPPLDKDLVV